MGNHIILGGFENPRRGGQAWNLTTNVPKILYLKSSSEQIFSKNCRWVPLICYLYFNHFFVHGLWQVMHPFHMVSFGSSRFFSFVNSWFLQINPITTGADQFRYYKLQIKVLVIAITFVASKNLREGIRIWTKLTERKPHKMNTSNLLAITRHDKKQSSKYFGE